MGLAIAHRAVITSKPCEVYLITFHIDFQPTTVMNRSVTDALAQAIERTRSMFEAK
jgi:hypothetical protein